SERDYDTYMQLYSLMMSMVRPPELLIYLKSSIEHLVANIQKRGREYEQSISIEYLSGLNRHYEEWIGNYKGRLLVIETDNLDFKNNPADFEKITDKIDAELFGLFK
ncbi:MAG: deoxynucleoside kinase, partial [Bacteroidales bacterium]|nr:deoxynucleoside kinase [Bacteroidales bacterium]